MNTNAFKIFSKVIIEIIVYGLLLYGSGVTSWLLIPAIVAFILSVRAAVIGLSFILAWFYRSPRPPAMQITIKQTLRMIVAEFISMLALYFGFQLFEQWFGTRQPPSNAPRRGLPIVLVHGFSCNGGYWWMLQRYLRQHEVWQTFTLNLEPIFADIDHFAAQLAKRVEEVCAITGEKQVILVGHSMGGLVARAYFQHYGGKERVAKIITLGSPHHGSELARLFGWINLRQMQPQNKWINELNEIEQQPVSIPITSIYTYHDNLIAPQESSALTHAKNIPIAGIGHIEMGFSPTCWKLVHQEIVNS